MVAPVSTSENVRTVMETMVSSYPPKEGESAAAYARRANRTIGGFLRSVAAPFAPLVTQGSETIRQHILAVQDALDQAFNTMQPEDTATTFDEEHDDVRTAFGERMTDGMARNVEAVLDTKAFISLVAASDNDADHDLEDYQSMPVLRALTDALSTVRDTAEAAPPAHAAAAGTADTTETRAEGAAPAAAAGTAGNATGARADEAAPAGAAAAAKRARTGDHPATPPPPSPLAQLPASDAAAPATAPDTSAPASLPHLLVTVGGTKHEIRADARSWGSVVEAVRAKTGADLHTGLFEVLTESGWVSTHEAAAMCRPDGKAVEARLTHNAKSCVSVPGARAYKAAGPFDLGLNVAQTALSDFGATAHVESMATAAAEGPKPSLQADLDAVDDIIAQYRLTQNSKRGNQTAWDQWFHYCKSRRHDPLTNDATTQNKLALGFIKWASSARTVIGPSGRTWTKTTPNAAKQYLVNIASEMRSKYRKCHFDFQSCQLLVDCLNRRDARAGLATRRPAKPILSLAQLESICAQARLRYYLNLMRATGPCSPNDQAICACVQAHAFHAVMRLGDFMEDTATTYLPLTRPRASDITFSSLAGGKLSGTQAAGAYPLVSATYRIPPGSIKNDAGGNHYGNTTITFAANPMSHACPVQAHIVLSALSAGRDLAATPLVSKNGKAFSKSKFRTHAQLPAHSCRGGAATHLLSNGTPGDAAIDLRDYRVTLSADVEALTRAAFGAEGAAAIKRSMALPPAHTTLRVNTLRTDRPAVLAALGVALRGFNERLVASGRPAVVPFAHPTVPDVVVIPSAPAAPAALRRLRRASPCRLGQLAFVPDSGDAAAAGAGAGMGASVGAEADFEAAAEPKPVAEVVVDRLCGEAILRGADVFARGVMAASPGIEAGAAVCVTVDLDAVSLRGSNDHRGRRLFVGRGRAALSRGAMFRAQRGLAVAMEQRVLGDAPPLNGVLPGLIYAQNLPSTIVGHALGALPGETVIDMCCAPGGKTAHVAALMQGRGTLVACDRSRRKAREVAALCEVHALGCVTAIARDATQLVLLRPEVLA
eukprot:g6280.t1